VRQKEEKTAGEEPEKLFIPNAWPCNKRGKQNIKIKRKYIMDLWLLVDSIISFLMAVVLQSPSGGIVIQEE